MSSNDLLRHEGQDLLATADDRLLSVCKCLNTNKIEDMHDFCQVCGEVGALRAVLAGGADAATADQHGGYPLHYAAQMCGAPAATDHQVRYTTRFTVISL